jgi:hypothetical protein
MQAATMREKKTEEEAQLGNQRRRRRGGGWSNAGAVGVGSSRAATKRAMLGGEGRGR